jgi:hypothetical protein
LEIHKIDKMNGLFIDIVHSAVYNVVDGYRKYLCKRSR